MATAEEVMPAKGTKSSYNHDNQSNDPLTKHMMKYDVNGDGQFSVAEVKAIVRELEQEEEQVKNMKTYICLLATLMLFSFVVIFGLVYMGIELTKEMRPKDSVMLDNDENPVQTATEINDGQSWNNRATDIATAVGSQLPVYQLDTLSNSALTSLEAVKVDTSPDGDSTAEVGDFTVYHVSTINVNRPASPGKVRVTITTALGETIEVHDSVAIIRDADGVQTHRITAPTPESGRRRRMQTGDDEIHATGCPPQKIVELEDAFNEIGSTNVTGPENLITRMRDNIGKELTIAEASQMIAANDLNGDGIVPRDEFVQAQCMQLSQNGSDPSCASACTALYETGQQKAGDECSASCFCRNLSEDACNEEYMCRYNYDAPSQCEVRPKNCDERCDADPHVCQWDESGNLASPSECERCHRSCYCQDLEEDQCHHDEMCTYDYSTHEAAATSATATTGRARRYLQDVSACTSPPEDGFIPPELRAAYVAPPEPEMVPCCNCGSCFEFGGPVTEACGEEGVLCCGEAADGTPWFSQPHHDYCAAEFGTASAGESRPSTEEEIVGGAPLTISPPCVARELNCWEVCDMDICNLNHGEEWTEDKARACGDCHTGCHCSAQDSESCHQYAECVWEPARESDGSLQAGGQCVTAPPSCHEMCDRADFCRWDGDYDQQECFTCRDDCACAARGDDLCVAPPRPDGRLGWRSMNGDQNWMMHIEDGATFPGTADPRTFPAPLDKTVDVCAEFCAQGGYQYLGLQWEAECYCSNEYDLRGEAAAHECGITEDHPEPRCATDEWTGWDEDTHFGGCGYRNAVFDVTTHEYIGCFIDGGENDAVVPDLTDEMRVHSGRECEIDEKRQTCVPSKPTCSQQCDWGICHEISREEERLRMEAEANVDEAALAAMAPALMTMPTTAQVDWRPCGQCHDECYCSEQEFSYSQETCARDSGNFCEWKETEISATVQTTSGATSHKSAPGFCGKAPPNCWEKCHWSDACKWVPDPLTGMEYPMDAYACRMCTTQCECHSEHRMHEFEMHSGDVSFTEFCAWDSRCQANNATTPPKCEAATIGCHEQCDLQTFESPCSWHSYDAEACDACHRSCCYSEEDPTAHPWHHTCDGIDMCWDKADGEPCWTKHEHTPNVCQDRHCPEPQYEEDEFCPICFDGGHVIEDKCAEWEGEAVPHWTSDGIVMPDVPCEATCGDIQHWHATNPHGSCHDVMAHYDHTVGCCYYQTETAAHESPPCCQECQDGCGGFHPFTAGSTRGIAEECLDEGHTFIDMSGPEPFAMGICDMEMDHPMFDIWHNQPCDRSCLVPTEEQPHYDDDDDDDEHEDGPPECVAECALSCMESMIDYETGQMHEDHQGLCACFSTCDTSVCDVETEGMIQEFLDSGCFMGDDGEVGREYNWDAMCCLDFASGACDPDVSLQECEPCPFEHDGVCDAMCSDDGTPPGQHDGRPGCLCHEGTDLADCEAPDPAQHDEVPDICWDLAFSAGCLALPHDPTLCEKLIGTEWQQDPTCYGSDAATRCAGGSTKLSFGNDCVAETPSSPLEPTTFACGYQCVIDGNPTCGACNIEEFLGWALEAEPICTAAGEMLRAGCGGCPYENDGFCDAPNSCPAGTDANDCDREKYIEVLQQVGSVCPNEFSACTGSAIESDCWFTPEIVSTPATATEPAREEITDWNSCPDTSCLAELFTSVDSGDVPDTGSDTMMNMVECYLTYNRTHNEQMEACPYINDGYCDEGEACDEGTDVDDCQAQQTAYNEEVAERTAQREAALNACEPCPTGFIEVEPCSVHQLSHAYSPACDLDPATDDTAECPSGCFLSTSYTPTCDLDWHTDEEFGDHCPPGCQYAEPVGAPATCTGSADTVPEFCIGTADEWVEHEWILTPAVCEP